MKTQGVRNDVPIDLGVSKKETPLGERKSISFLLGAGFSVPKGYPTGKDVNDALENFDQFPIDFSPAGELTISMDGNTPQFSIYGQNQFQKFFTFCKRLIKKYTILHSGFDYEDFFDFIKSKEVFFPEYDILCNDLIDDFNNYQSFVWGIEQIYNQMVGYIIHDGEGLSWYDGEPNRLGFIEGYDGILNVIQSWSKDFIVNVHTLNHDMLFESFRRTEYLAGQISDGFDEYGSPYYGRLHLGNASYNVRLERYKARYNTPVRLYKLHGSLDYILYYRTIDNCILIPDNFVKLRQKMSPMDLMKARKNRMGYEKYPFAYHADFLTGSKHKIKRYSEPLLFSKLFKRFRNNLRKAEILVIIGYGGKDKKINEMIIEHFDFNKRPVFIFDPYPSDALIKLASSLNTNVIEKSVEMINENDFNSKKI